MNKAELTTSITRLKKLAAVVMAVPNNKWNMDTFGTKPRRGSTQCGTACCVLGHAAITPEFNAQGLKWAGKKYTYEKGLHWAIRLGDLVDGPAGRKFFGLTAREEDKLFFDGWEKTQTQKVQEILALVVKRERMLTKAKE